MFNSENLTNAQTKYAQCANIPCLSRVSLQPSGHIRLYIGPHRNCLTFNTNENVKKKNYINSKLLHVNTPRTDRTAITDCTKPGPSSTTTIPYACHKSWVSVNKLENMTHQAQVSRLVLTAVENIHESTFN